MKHFSFYSIRGRLIFVLLLAVIPALVLTLYTASEERRHELAEVQDNAMHIASIIAVQEEQLLVATRQLLISLSHFPVMTDGRSTACNALFADLREKHYQRYSNIGVAKPNGDVVCSALSLASPVNIADRKYFKDAIKARDFSIGDYQIGRITGKPSVNFGYPVIDKRGNIKGVVFAAMDLQWFKRFEIEVTSKLPKGSTLTKIDGKGIILVHHNGPEELFGKPFPIKSLLETIKTQENGVVKAIDGDDIPRIYAFRSLHSKVAADKIYVILGIPVEVAFAEINLIMTRNLTLIGLVALFVLAAVWFGSNRLIMRPVNALLDATRRLSSGDLGARSGFPYRRGELGQLSHAFDEMAETLQREEEERKQAEARLRVSREQLRALAGRLQAVREEERTNVAREIHDELGGALTGLKVDLSFLTKSASKIENEAVRTSLLTSTDSINKSIDTTINAVRRIAMELRPGVLDDLGLVAALEWQLKDFEKRTGIRSEFFPPVEEISFDADLSTALFRIFQEALTNVARHSGATEVRVRMDVEADSSTLEVEDNGKGIEKEKTLSSKSIGLLGMRERVQMFGGRFTVTGTPGKGTKVTVEIPPVEKRQRDQDQGGASG
jgi:signal transduction histidine kinase